MAERTNPHANLIIGAQDEASPVFDKIKASSQGMAEGVKQAAKQAAKETKLLGDETEKSHKKMGGLADPAVPAAQKFQKSTESMIRQVRLLNAELEAGGRNNSAFIEKKASIYGADPLALAPYLEDLKKAEAAQRVATTGLDQMGMSAKQTTAALRGVPAQFTDIVTSLQGGQAPLTVFLQQGGQLKDMFGGAGNAAKALGGYVFGLISPLTIAAAAAVALAVAYKQGSAEADAYNRSIAMTGNAAGTTAAQLQTMAARISTTVGTQSDAADTLAQLVSTGRVAQENLEQFATTAVQLERTAGVAIKDTVKDFAELGKAPVEASKKLNESYGFLTASVYEQIVALQEQGRVLEAAAVAQQAYDRAMANVAATMQGQLGYIERGWRALADAAKAGWDAMLNVGRADTLTDKLNAARAALDQRVNTPLAVDNEAMRASRQKGIDSLRQEIALLTEQERMMKRGAEAQALRTQAEKDGIAAAEALQKAQDKGLSKQQQLNKALEDYRKQMADLRAVNPNSERLTPAAVARGEKGIRDQFKETGSAGTGENEVAQIRARTIELERYLKLLRTHGAEAEKMTESEKLVIKIQEELKTSITGTARAQKEKALAEAQGQVAVERQVVAEQARIKALKESEAALNSQIDAVRKQASSTLEQAVAQESVNANMGKSKTAVEQATLAQLKLQQAEADASDRFAPAYIAALTAKTEAQERFVKALQQAEFLQKSQKLDEAGRAAAEETATLELQISLIGRSQVERDKIIAQRQAEARLAKELAEIEKINLGEGPEAEAKRAELRAKAQANAVVEANNAANKAVLGEWQRTADSINQSLTDALLRGFESGKDFAKNLRDTVVNMFKTLVLRPIISAVVSPVAGAINGALYGGSPSPGGGGGLMGGIQTASNLNTLWGAGSQALFGGAAGASAASLGYANLVGMAGGDAIGALATANGMWAGVATGAQAAAQSAIEANLAVEAGAAEALPAGTLAIATGDGAAAGSGIMGALNAIPGWGWALAGVALLGGMLSKKQTLHSGAGAIYSADQGLQEGASIYNQSTFKMGDVREYNKDGQALASGIAAGLGATLDGLAKAFGQKAGYEVATAFADDTSKDGAWGALRISQGGKDLLNWQDTRTSRWAPKEFADGAEGQAQYLAAIANDTRKVLLDMDLPGWADTMLNRLGELSNMDQLSAAVAQIAQAQTAFEAFGQYMPTFAGLADSAISKLVDASGGVQALAGNMATFVDQYYTDAEKLAVNTENVRVAMGKLGFEMPSTRDEFRALVEANIALGDAGAETVAKLLQVSGAFASVTAASETAADAAARLADEQAKAAKEAQDAYQKQAQAAQDAADAARRAHESLLEALTKAAEQALVILGNAIDAEKKEQQAWYDAQMVIIAAQRKASTTFVEAQRAWLGVAIGGAQNYAKVMESEAARIRGFFTGMVLQDDPDAPAGASTFAAQAALRAGDKSDAVLRKATDIDPEMFASWADYAVNFFETQGLVGGVLQGAERAASMAYSDVALLEQQLTLAEDKYHADLDHYTRLEGIAKDTLEANILRLDGILQAAQDQLAEALGTKLAVMGLGAALGNFSGAVARLSDVTKNPVTTPLSTTAPVLTTYGTADRAEALVAQVTAYNPVISGATSSRTNNPVVDVLREVVAELQALRTTGVDTKAAVEKTTALLDQVTGGGNAMLTETA